jgi:hypothetical protein
LYGITERSIWFDEAASWRTIQFPWREMFSRVAADNHLPFYFILLKLWTGAFGDSLLAMRGLSVIFSGAAMAGVYLFACEAFRGAPSAGAADLAPSSERGRWVGLVAAAFVAVSLLQIKAAEEVRMYTLGTALTAFSSWTLFRALHAQGSLWRPWTIHTATTLLLAYTHHFAIFSIAAQVLFLAGYYLAQSQDRLAALFTNRSLRAAIVCYGFVAVSCGLRVPVLLQQAQNVQQGWWLKTLTGKRVLLQLREVCIGNPRPDATDDSLPIAPAVYAATLAALVFRGRAAHYYILSLAVVPLAGAATYSWIGKNVFFARYLVFAQMFLLIGIAAALAKLPFPRLRDVAAGLLAITGGALIVEYWSALEVARRPGMRGAISQIESQRRPEERVLVLDASLYLPALYHLADRSFCHLYAGNRPIPRYNGVALLRDDDFISTEQVERLGPGGVWAIRLTDPLATMPPPNWRLDQQIIIRDVRDRHGDIEVARYEVTAGTGP